RSGAGAESVHGFGGVPEEGVVGEMGDRGRDRLCDLGRSAEGENHEESPASNSARARSSGLVILKFREESATILTATPMRSTSSASSVPILPSPAARRYASRSTDCGNPCGVWARQRPSRGSVRETREGSDGSASLSVSLRGMAAMAGSPLL